MDAVRRGFFAVIFSCFKVLFALRRLVKQDHLIKKRNLPSLCFVFFETKFIRWEVATFIVLGLFLVQSRKKRWLLHHTSIKGKAKKTLSLIIRIDSVHKKFNFMHEHLNSPTFLRSCYHNLKSIQFDSINGFRSCFFCWIPCYFGLLFFSKFN